MTHEELRELINADVPINQPTPDPAWDYYQLWEDLHEFKNKIDEMISFVSQYENSTQDADEQIRRKLSALLYSFEDLPRTAP